MVDKKQELETLVKNLYFFNAIHSFQMDRAISFAEALRSHYGDEVIDVLKGNEDSWKEILGFYMKQTANLINLCREKYGDEVIDILKNLDREERLKAGRNCAISEGKNSLEDLIAHHSDSTIVEKGDDFILFRSCADQCRVGILAKELGMSDLMYNLHCGNDPAFTEGFNPDLVCEVKKTAMYDDCCEHLIRYKKPLDNLI